MANRHFFYAKKSLVSTVDDSCTSGIVRGSGLPLAEYSSSAQTALLATDASHSILLTDNQTAQQDNVYTPYGYMRRGGARQRLAFNGEHHDHTELYLLGNGNRAYNLRLMRFNSPDRTGIFTQGNYNAYAYCNCDPVNYKDPTANIRSAAHAAANSRAIQAHKAIAAARLTKQRLNTRTRQIVKLSGNLKSLQDSKDTLTEILAISTQHQDGKLDFHQASAALTKVLPFTQEGGDAHKKVLNLSPNKINELIDITLNKGLAIDGIRRKIAELLPLHSAEALAHIEVSQNAQAAVASIDKRLWKATYEGFAKRQQP